MEEYNHKYTGYEDFDPEEDPNGKPPKRSFWKEVIITIVCILAVIGFYAIVKGI